MVRPNAATETSDDPTPAAIIGISDAAIRPEYDKKSAANPEKAQIDASSQSRPRPTRGASTEAVAGDKSARRLRRSPISPHHDRGNHEHEYAKKGQ